MLALQLRSMALVLVKMRVAFELHTMGLIQRAESLLTAKGHGVLHLLFLALLKAFIQ